MVCLSCGLFIFLPYLLNDAKNKTKASKFHSSVGKFSEVASSKINNLCPGGECIKRNPNVSKSLSDVSLLGDFFGGSK